MDNLTKNAILAKQSGMSYGQWMAIHNPDPIVKKEIPDGWKACPYCGKPFKTKQGKKYCDMYCRNMAYKERTRKGYKNGKT